jgi:hypothetical protein
VTVLNARCSARARPKAARVHHRPPGARPGHHRDPDPAARKADELDWRAEPAASHRTHPPAVDVDRGAYQPTTPWLPQPDSQRPPAAPRQHDARSLLPAVPTSGGPETRWQTIPWPNLEWHSSAVQPSTRLAYGVPSAATTTSRKSNSSPPRTVDCQRARRCQRCSRWVEDFAERQIKASARSRCWRRAGSSCSPPSRSRPCSRRLPFRRARRVATVEPSRRSGRRQVAAAAAGRCPLRGGPFVVWFKTTLARREL